MSYKKLILSLLILTLLMGSAYAANDTDVDSALAEDVDSQDNIGQTVLSDGDVGSSDNELLKANHTFTGNTFSQLQSEIDSCSDGDTIFLNNDVKQTGNTFIAVSKSITIDGNGHTIDAMHKSQIFIIGAFDVVLKNIKLINTDCANGNAEYGGAVRFDSGFGSVLNCSFINSSAIYGGAIYLGGSQTNIINCSFINSSANYGGAVYIRGSNNRILNCSFIENSANNDGGAIALSVYDAIISGCSFEKNTAMNDGGAIMWNHYRNANISITNCSFTGNGAEGKGSAIYYSLTGNLNLNNVNFTGNKVKTTIKLYYAGNNRMAAHVMGFNSCFNGIYADEDITLNAKNVCWWNGSEYVLEIDETMFIEANRLSDACNVKTNLIGTDKNNKIILNTTNITDDEGVAYFDIGSAEGHNSFISTSMDNEQYYPGESNRYTFSNGDFALLQKYIADNIAKGIYNIVLNRDYTYTVGSDVITEGIEITADNITVDGNGHTINAMHKSRIFNVDGKNVVLKNMKLSNSQEEIFMNGIAIYWRGDYGSIINCTFTGTNGEAGGEGTVYWDGDYGNLLNCTFTDNYAPIGGAVYWNGDYGELFNCSFENNSATYGGAVYWIGDAGCINNCNFANLSAEFGSAIYLNGANSSIYDCNFEDNDGRAIDLRSDAGRIFNCIFRNNDGGAITGGGLNSEIYNCSFIGNSAEEGGAIYAPYDNTTIYNCTFIDNSADNGGAVYLASWYKTDEWGDIIGWYGLNIHVYNCIFKGNSAKNYGSAVYSRCDKGSITNSVLIDNKNKYVIYFSKDYFISKNYNNYSFDFNNNWFGNNVTNLNKKPEVNVDVDAWYVLDDGKNNSFALNNIYNSTGATYIVGVGDCLLPSFKLALSSDDVVLLDDEITVYTNGLSESIDYIPPADGKYVKGTIGSASMLVKLSDSGFTKYETIINAQDCYVYIDEELFNYSITLTDSKYRPVSNRTVVVTFNSKQYSRVSDAEGRALFELNTKDLALGSYNISASFEGDSLYNASEYNGTLSIVKYGSVLTANDLIVPVGNKVAIYAVSLTDSKSRPIVGKMVVVTFNSRQISNFTDSNGVASFKLDISQLSSEEYRISATFEGDAVYNASKINSTLSIKPSSSIRITVINGLDVTAVLLDSKGNGIGDAEVFYTLNSGDKISAFTNQNGEFVMSAESSCVLDMIFEGNDDFAPCNASVVLKNIAPKIIGTYIEAQNPFTRTAVDYKAGERGYMFYFTLKDENGKVLPNKKVKIGIDGKIYTVTTDKDGKAGQMINMPSENSYTYALCFLGDEDYKASFAVSRLVVVKKAVTITPAKTSYTFKSAAKTKTITATLKSTNSYIPKGKQVTLTIAGTTFKATIGDKGQISLNIGSITKKGTYKVAISFAGTVTYAAANSKTITVKIS